MAAYIIQRLLQTVVVLVIVTFICFLLIHIIPGDPVLALLGLDATPEEAKNLRTELWLDRPMMVQYFHWLGNVLQGDLGTSIQYRESVAGMIMKRLPITMYLGILSFIFSAVIGTTVGTFCAIRRGSFLDQAVTFIANIGIATPQFWIAIMLIWVVGLQLGWLPIQGYTSPFKDFWLSIQKIIMPVFCLGFISVASLARYARSSMLEVIHQDYIRTAWAKGLRERSVIINHALKNSLIPVVTMLGMRIRVIFGGSIIIETVFNIPGLGRLLVNSVFDKDFVVVQAGVMLLAVVVALANLAVDISYGYLDPRVRYN